MLFTNYQFYIDEFIKLGHAEMANPDSPYDAFIEPATWSRAARSAAGPDDSARQAPPRPAADAGLPPDPQRPQRHHHGQHRRGAGQCKTITDHIAVLRPHAWLMLGHCAGLRTTQQLGDYVLAHAYVREDHVLDEELPLWVPIRRWPRSSWRWKMRWPT